MSGRGASSSDDVDRTTGTRRIVSVMGTLFVLDLRDLDPASPAADEVVAWWHWVDDTFSIYRPTSQVSQLASGAIELRECAPEVAYVLDLCAQAAEISDGCFSAHPAGQLDLSGMVKGWSLDVASQMLRRAGSRHHCICAGSDFWCLGRPQPAESWRVGVFDPHDASRLLAVVEAPPGHEVGLAVATSGTAVRGARIVDPHTGETNEDLAELTVIGADVTFVGWVATAGFAMGHDSRPWLEGLPGIEAFAVTPDGDYWGTDGIESVARLVAEPLARGTQGR